VYGEREKRGDMDGSERHYNGWVGGHENLYLVLKVPRQYPLVLLEGVKHFIGINLDLILWGQGGLHLS
jgi:hypothetical protein